MTLERIGGDTGRLRADASERLRVPRRLRGWHRVDRDDGDRPPFAGKPV